MSIRHCINYRNGRKEEIEIPFQMIHKLLHSSFLSKPLFSSLLSTAEGIWNDFDVSEKKIKNFLRWLVMLILLLILDVVGCRFTYIFHFNSQLTQPDASWLGLLLNNEAIYVRMKFTQEKRKKIYTFIQWACNLIRLERICNRSPTLDVVKCSGIFHIFLKYEKKNFWVSTFFTTNIACRATPWKRGKVIFNAAYQCYEFFHIIFIDFGALRSRLRAQRDLVEISIYNFFFCQLHSKSMRSLLSSAAICKLFYLY